MFWERFYNLCIKNGESPNGVAKKLGISSGAITWWKKGERTPHPSTAQKIAEYFNVSVAYLKGEADDPTPENKKISFDKETQSIIFSSQEENIVIAYRNADPVTKRNVNKLLDIEEEQFQPITINYAARSGDSGEIEISKENIEKIKNLPDVNDDI